MGIEIAKRDAEWNQKVVVFKNDHQNSLNDIQIGKINSTYKQNLELINKANNNKYIKEQQVFDNLIYNNKLARVRDIHPILYFIQDNKKYNNLFSKKEKAFELFYKNILKKEPEILVKNTFEELNVNSNGPLVDVTFDKYVDDNIYRISNYEVYRNESWISYLKLYEIDNDIKSKNDPSDI